MEVVTDETIFRPDLMLEETRVSSNAKGRKKSNLRKAKSVHMNRIGESDADSALEPRIEKESAPLPVRGPLRSLLELYVRQPEFKRVLNRLLVLQSKEKFLSLSVLSEQPGDGKTFFVSALALSYAMFLRKRVLILDTVHQTVEESLYFRSLLEPRGTGSKTSRPACVNLITTRSLGAETLGERQRGDCQRNLKEFGYDSLDVSDFLIGEFIESQKSDYDLILLDTCALVSSNARSMDPIVIATQTDRVLFVLSEEALESETEGRLQEALSHPGVNPIGAVTNPERAGFWT